MPLKESAKQCAAKSKRSTKRCKNPAIVGCDKCRMHGGKTPSGIASPNFVHGKYSKVLPPQVAATYEKGLDDKELCASRNEIALIDAFLYQRLEKLYAGETADAWKLIKQYYNRYVEVIEYLKKKREAEEFPEVIGASGRGRPQKVLFTQEDADELLAKIGHTIIFGLETYHAFEIVQPMLEQRRRSVETEAKLMLQKEQMLTVEAAMGIVYLQASIIKRYISDVSILELIGKDLVGSVNISERKI